MSQMLMVFCPHCGEMVEHTVGFTVEEFAKKQEEGIKIGYVDYNAPFKCPHCGKKINPKKDRLDGTAALMD